MKTTFFTFLVPILAGKGLNFTVLQKDGKMNLAVFSTDSDGDKQDLKPFVATGTPEEFDEEFFTALIKAFVPIAPVAGLQTNADDVAKAIAEEKKPVVKKAPVKAVATPAKPVVKAPVKKTEKEVKAEVSKSIAKNLPKEEVKTETKQEEITFEEPVKVAYTDGELLEFKKLIMDKMKAIETDLTAAKDLEKELEQQSADCEDEIKLGEFSSKITNARISKLRLTKEAPKYQEALARVISKTYGLSELDGKLIPMDALKENLLLMVNPKQS